MTSTAALRITPFNGAVEIGLRALTILNEAYPAAYSLEKLTVFDYLIVHSDDMPNGPSGLHPKTPHRAGELLVRRQILEEGLRLYESRALVEQVFKTQGVFYRATERSAGFLDVLATAYLIDLRERSLWLVRAFGVLSDNEVQTLVRTHLGVWGAEFELDSVLWSDDTP